MRLPGTGSGERAAGRERLTRAPWANTSCLCDAQLPRLGLGTRRRCGGVVVVPVAGVRAKGQERVRSLPIADGAAQATWAGLVFSRSDEFGNPVPLTGAGAPNAPPVRYGWLGAAQRSGEALGGVILMGVRLYHPGTGRFASVDPVPGGSASAYDYCNADPVNCTDLNGEWPSFKSILSVVATVGEIASLIPGPIGAAAAGVSAIAYAAQGNTAKAIEMGITAAAALVGAGAVVKVAARAVTTARSAGQVAARAAPKVVRAASAGASRVRSAVRSAASHLRRAPTSCPINSFVPGTLVVLADGSLAPIESLQTEDLVWTTDPVTGEDTAQPVLSTITGTGDKHLIDVVTDAGTWTATAEHPIWVHGKGWTTAADLTVGDQLVGSTGGLLVVRAMHDQGWLSGQTVHNLHVAATHTYYIASPDGNLDTLVHNAGRACSIAAHNVPRGSGIYIMRFPGGKFYVGQSRNMHARIHQHLGNSGRFTGQTPVSIRTVSLSGALDAAEARVIRGMGGIGHPRLLNIRRAPR